jgi:NTP pyrophosphatase (non-canonical NTP hydrolase)
MNFEEYQTFSMRTAADSGDKQRDLIVSALGLAGEVGEVVELVKKDIGHGRKMDLVKLQAELGDVLWYLSDLASRYDLDLGQIAANNVAKLKQRYPAGFTPAVL